MRSLVRIAGLALLALLVMAPAASASRVSVQDSVVVYDGDAGADTVDLQRAQSDNNRIYYVVVDDEAMTAGPGCTKSSNMPFVFCEVGTPLRRYDIETGAGDDAVRISGDSLGGSTDLGVGHDTFSGRPSGAAADTVHGSAGDDVLKGGTGNDLVFGDSGNDQVAGEGGNDAVDGGDGDDQLEFGGDEMVAGAGLGADDIHGGPGLDRLSYLDHSAGVRVSVDDQPNDAEGDNVHSDVDVLVGSTHDDALTGADGPQQLFGNSGLDRVDGLGGDDIVNGGTDDDELYGGPGVDRVEGSAGEDYLEGGAGEDIFEGDNVCTVEPCTGGSDFIQARDGEADTVNCGVGADTALVDDIDVVAQDTQHGCERIERTAAAVPAPPAASEGGVLGATASAPRMRLIGARKLSSLRRGRFRIQVTCPGSCRVKARLIAGRTVVAGKSRVRLGAGTIVLKPKTNAKGRKLLKRRSKVGMTLAVDVTDDQGRVTTLARVLTFRK